MPILLAALVFLGTTIVPTADVTPSEVVITIAPSSDQPLQLLRRPTPDTYTCDALAIEPGTSRAFRARARDCCAGHQRKDHGEARRCRH